MYKQYLYLLQIERNLEAKRAHKRKVRDAIYTMSVIVASYLLCNGMNVLMVVMEKFIRPAILFTQKRGQTDLYIGITDMISFLYMFFSSTRLIVYYVCNPQTRLYLGHILPRACTKFTHWKRLPIIKFSAGNAYWRANTRRTEYMTSLVDKGRVDNMNGHDTARTMLEQRALLHNDDTNGCYRV